MPEIWNTIKIMVFFMAISGGMLAVSLYFRTG